MILIIIWWLQKLGKYWQQIKKQHRSLMWRDLISKSLSELEIRKQYLIKISNKSAALGNVNDKTGLEEALNRIANLRYRESRSV